MTSEPKTPGTAEKVVRKTLGKVSEGRDAITQRAETAVDLGNAFRNFYLAALTQPTKAMTQSMNASMGILASLSGTSEIAPEKGDRRFSDPVWATNPAYRALMQSYLSWAKASNDWIDSLDLPHRDKLRARLLTSLSVDALSPTNFLVGNPSAMKATLENGGKNLWKGARQLIEDMVNNGGLPTMVDKSKFSIGENLALTKGHVIYAEDHLELIQYAPRTPEVHKVPVFIVPPQINKYYVWDLAPGRSIVEYLVEAGHEVFIVSWRNPTTEQAAWGLASYIEALDRASAVACEVSGSPELNVVGACSGGITAALLLALWGARGDNRAASLSLLVAILDVEGGKDTSMGLFANIETLELAKLFSRSKGVLGGKDLERAFAWLRPNDLIWAYWVNNYLLGNDPAAFDILYWNADTTNLPAALHNDLLTLLQKGGLADGGEGRVFVDGHELDLKDVTCDAFLVGGETDHITPWDGCYLTRKLLGGKSEFILSQAGHIQSLINPPGNKKARFLINSGEHDTAEAFLSGAETNEGSWWPTWQSWLEAHSGDKVPARKQPGSRKRKPICEAPGNYVSQPA
ncbi:alpha/beta hydrolase [Paracoccus sp. SCSIO 75233]|uniref:PHA/PHB synthase family protein n=1 Tax=Paracoccus sp. SCSIO 75233 TaxID=3017782 RepID=UPI0022EFEF5E|nr:alpha/beta fold hydrolase [Paracoccus sp. SCSIO 75233]WBU53348.1 alpha/beta fold hydrolase [Paracoccus sp. SCSIO 75233]